MITYGEAAIIAGVAVTSGVVGAFWYHEIREGVESYLKASHALEMIGVGDRIRSEYRYDIQDAGLNLVSSVLFGMTGGRKKIFRAFHKRRKVLEEMALSEA